MELMTTKEVSVMFGVTVCCVYDWIKAGLMPDKHYKKQGVSKPAKAWDKRDILKCRPKINARRSNAGKINVRKRSKDTKQRKCKPAVKTLKSTGFDLAFNLMNQCLLNR